MKIELRGVHAGKEIIFDDDMAEVALTFTWVGHSAPKSRTTYARSRSFGDLVYAHHLVIGKPPAGFVTDHINGNGLDNRRANLRHVSQSENMKAAFQRLGDDYDNQTRGGLRTTIKYLADGTPKTYFYDRKTGKAVAPQDALQRFGDAIPDKTLAGIRTAAEPDLKTGDKPH